jgi:hypothetical protein
MKNLILSVVGLFISLTLSAQTKLYKGLYVGMTRSEAKAEFNKNKEQYETVQVGIFQYRLFLQNNQYDKEGKLYEIRFAAKASGMSFTQSEGIDRLRDFIRFANENGYTSDGVSVGASEFQFDKNGEYQFISPQKDKFIKLVFFPNGTELIFVTLWVGSYSQEVKNALYKTNDF